MHRRAFQCEGPTRAVANVLRHKPHASTTARGVQVRAQAVASTAAAEQQVLDAIASATGRGKEGIGSQQQAALDAAVEALERDGGIAGPTGRPEVLDGSNCRWQLLYTSRPGTASPIQRAFTGTEAFTIFQEVRLSEGEDARVNNVVELGENAKVGVLRVEAEASTDSRPRDGFVPRRGAGLPLFGKSQTGPPAKQDMRIDFQFDKAAFDFRALPFKVPYPVPFKILGDETKGWIDVTYLNDDGTFRLARGNKGTLFVLVKRETDVDSLLVAIRDKEQARVSALIARLTGKSVVEAPARDKIALGKWKLLWTEEGKKVNPLQKALIGKTKNWQIIEQSSEFETTLENRVDLGLARVRALATCKAIKDTRSQVKITEIFAEAFGRKLPFPDVPRDDVGWVEWLYVDERVRITRGNRGSTFVHERETTV